MNKSITINNNNITKVFKDAIKALESQEVPEPPSGAWMSNWTFWVCHDRSTDVFKEAQKLNKRFWRKKYKLLDKRTRGCKLINKEFHRFMDDVSSGKVETTFEALMPLKDNTT